MKKLIFSTIVALSTLTLNAQNVNIPDANFKAYLVGNTSINTNMDTEIQVSEANAFTGFLNCQNLGITSLTGIEAFTNMTILLCSNNNLGVLDLTSNLSLLSLYCENTNISILDLSNHSLLNYLWITDNNLTTIDLSNLSNLYEFRGGFNPFQTIDFSNNANLGLIVMNHNTASAGYVSPLNFVNLANGNNAALTGFTFEGHPNLTCIKVDNTTWSNTNWPSNIYLKEATTNYDENCTPCIVNIPDANFKAYLVGHSGINTNSDTEIQCSEATAFTSQIWIQALGISDLTGLEAFTNLTSLNCNSNLLTSIDVSSNTALAILNIAGNSISSLDVSANSNLYDLFCDYNDITSIDLSTNLALGKLNINNNQLTVLDLSNNNLLFQLGCESNELTTLNVKNTNNTNVTAFYVTGNPNLTCIEVDDVAYSTTNWTNIDAGASFSLDCGSASINENTSVELTIFPNPASEVITVSSDSKIEEVRVFDTYGNLVNTFNSSSFSVRELSAGIYFLNITTDNGIAQSKFIKE